MPPEFGRQILSKRGFAHLTLLSLHCTETMGVKGYHFYLKKFGGYSEDIDLREFVKDRPVNTIVVDFCAFYMSKLKSPRYATALLLEKIMEKSPESGSLGLPLVHQPLQKIVEALIKEIREEIDGFVGSLPSQPRVCFVLDGEPLPAKHGTHKFRARRSYQHLKAARRLVNLYIGRQTQAPSPATAATKFLARFGARASGWIRWFRPLKQHIVQELVRCGCANSFDPQGESKLSVIVAPFEADPKCVELASLCPNSMILSSDGDLQIYPFADDSLVGRAPIGSDLLLFQVTFRC